MSEMQVTSPRAYHFTAGTNEPVTRIVLHDEEYPQSVHSAEDVARYFAQASSGGSAHYIVDADSTQHPLPENVIAWHAPPNQGSIGIEHDGYARFTAAEWSTPQSIATFSRSAALVAEICKRRSIPAVFLSAETLQINPGARGITTHWEVTKAFRQSDHTDPGPNFPISNYMSSVARLLATPPVTTWYFRLIAYTPSAPMMYGADVRHVQWAIGAGVDGWYGPSTRARVMSWQANHLSDGRWRRRTSHRCSDGIREIEPQCRAA
jgi:hypothetical protein